MSARTEHVCEDRRDVQRNNETHIVIFISQMKSTCALNGYSLASWDVYAALVTGSDDKATERLRPYM